MDECILSNPLDIAVKAPQVSSNYALKALVNGVFFVSNLFIFVNNVLEHGSNHGNQSNDERSECN